MNKVEVLFISIIVFSCIGLIIETIMIANAQILSPSTPQELTDLEKQQMQTIYEDEEKKIMLPYDPNRVMQFIMLAIILSFISGLLAGIAIQKYSKSRKDI